MKYIINLNVRSNYSFLTSTIKIADYIAFAKKNNLKALSLVDNNVLYGAYEFYTLCLSNDIKPLLGLNCIWEVGSEQVQLTMMATTYSGYQKLMALVTVISINNGTINSQDVIKYLNKSREILVIIHTENQNVRYIRNFYDILNSSGHELIYFGITPIDMINYNLFRAITPNIIPIDLVLYLDNSDHRVWQVLQAIKNQKTLQAQDLINSNQFLYKDHQQLKQDYLPEIIDNLEKVILLCSVVFPKNNAINNLNLPHFPCPSGLTSAVYLQELCKQGLVNRFRSHEIASNYITRIFYELQIINKMGFADYFLIVNDYVNFAKSQNILVGPGRGSVAGSLVAYVLGITDVDPIAYQLIFERFLNPQRTSLPDIDLDFEDTRRDEVINYIYQKYGQNHVAYITTFQTMTSKMALRDVGRIFQIKIEDINEMTKLILVATNFELASAIKNSPKLTWYANKYPLLFNVSQKIIGFPRQTSTHAAGLIISQLPLIQVVPLQIGFHGIFQTQFPMPILAKLGLVKMDILGLRNLTILQNILQQIKQHYTVNINLSQLPLNDSKSFNIIKNGDTTGIFQLESEGMRQVLRAVKPDNLEDLIAISALFRPGPQTYIQTYINCKLKKAKVSYVHAHLQPYLANTYGIIVYQEQILQILQTIAGYSLADADLIRRAISKKNINEMKQLAKQFMTSAITRGYRLRVVKRIWEDIAKFAGYGFNRAHAVAYSLISYYLVYLKANYPLAFMVSLLTSVIGDDQKMRQFLNECQKYKIKVLLPSVQFSGIDFLIDVHHQALRYSLQAIKQISQGLCVNLIKERVKNGLFTDFFNFCARATLVGLNQKNIEYLIAAGALDDLESNRTILLLNLGAALEYARMVQITNESGSVVLNFNLIAKPVMLQQMDDWNNNSINEHRALGVYLKYNPKTIWKAKLDPKDKTVNLSDISNYLNQYVRVYGIINNIKTIKNKKQKMMAFLELQNDNNVIEVTVFDKIYENEATALQINKVILMEAKVELYNEKVHLVLIRILVVL